MGYWLLCEQHEKELKAKGQVSKTSKVIRVSQVQCEKCSQEIMSGKFGKFLK